jgi:hypothetical protein
LASKLGRHTIFKEMLELGSLVRLSLLFHLPPSKGDWVGVILDSPCLSVCLSVNLSVDIICLKIIAESELNFINFVCPIQLFLSCGLQP